MEQCTKSHTEEMPLDITIYFFIDFTDFFFQTLGEESELVGISRLMVHAAELGEKYRSGEKYKAKDPSEFAFYKKESACCHSIQLFIKVPKASTVLKYCK